MDILNAIEDFISKVGFPVFVAIYLLVRFESVITNNTNAVTTLATLVNRLLNRELGR